VIEKRRAHIHHSFNTIQAQVQAALGLEAGSRVEFVEGEKGQGLLVPATDDVQSLKGMLRKPCPPVSIEDMNRAIAERGAGR
jgi:antitoxin PrlF